MDIKNMLNIINKNEKKLGDIMVLNTGKRMYRFQGYKLVAKNDLVKEICNKYIESAYIEINSKEIETYDFDLNDNNSILKLDSKFVDENNFENIMSGEDYEIINKKTDFRKFNYVAVNYSYNKELITIFSKYKQPSNKFKKSFKLTFMNDEIKEYKDDILYFDNIVDFVKYKNFYYIIDDKSFRAMFDYKSGIKKYILENTEEVKAYNLIDRFDDFINDCVNDGRYNLRLCKAIDKKGFNYILDNKEHLNKYFDKFGVQLNLDDSNMIIYKGKECIGELINVLLRKYVFDGLNNELAIARGGTTYVENN